MIHDDMRVVAVRKLLHGFEGKDARLHAPSRTPSHEYRPSFGTSELSMHDGKICTRERVLVSAPMGGDRVKHGYGGMVPAASRLGRCPPKCESPSEAASRLETLSTIVPRCEIVRCIVS